MASILDISASTLNDSLLQGEEPCRLPPAPSLPFCPKVRILSVYLDKWFKIAKNHQCAPANPKYLLSCAVGQISVLTVICSASDQQPHRLDSACRFRKTATRKGESPSRPRFTAKCAAADVLLRTCQLPRARRRPRR